MLSVLDIFKIGIGPSSSHTMGPMKAGYDFIEQLIARQHLAAVNHIVVELYGSLSLTGKGHLSDVAIIMGLAGYLPDNVDPDGIGEFIAQVKTNKRLPIARDKKQIAFDFEQDLIFHAHILPLHENGLVLSAYCDDTLCYQNTYYSTGGGFIVDEAHFSQALSEQRQMALPFPFNSAADLLAHCQKTGLSLAGLVAKNELSIRSRDELEGYFVKIWQTMSDCIEKGINNEGLLPGPLKVTRRAPLLYKKLTAYGNQLTDPMQIIDWVNLFAMAVNEQNAAAGRVVTAPTNGACGIVPAVLAYYDRFIHPLTPQLMTTYFLASGVIGVLYKTNASISGAEVGCQGEVGVACSMAAAGLAELLGGTPQQVCCAAEIGMEHNLGLTCDPVAGQVQIPCIERNAIAAVKAINAARMALDRTSKPFVSLDDVIATMYATGKDMNQKYRETSLGGLAITIKAACE